MAVETVCHGPCAAVLVSFASFLRKFDKSRFRTNPSILFVKISSIQKPSKSLHPASSASRDFDDACSLGSML